jgi:ABC-type nitrate/sulfonate/bicarbonate transport system permease component
MVLISKQSIRDYGKGLALIVILLIVWEGLALLIQNNYILPRLGEILSVLLQPAAPVLGGESLIQNTIQSLREVLTGFLCAAAIAIPLGLFIGWSKEVQTYLNPTSRSFARSPRSPGCRLPSHGLVSVLIPSSSSLAWVHSSRS